MFKKRSTVVCEPFTLDRSQAKALVQAVAGVIADELIRERDEREAAQLEATIAEREV